MMLSRLLLILVLACGAPLTLAMDRDQAAAKAREMTGGRVLAVEQAEQGGRIVYKVKVLTPSGDVRIVIIKGNGGGR